MKEKERRSPDLAVSEKKRRIPLGRGDPQRRASNLFSDLFFCGRAYGWLFMSRPPTSSSSSQKRKKRGEQWTGGYLLLGPPVSRSPTPALTIERESCARQVKELVPGTGCSPSQQGEQEEASAMRAGEPQP